MKNAVYADKTKRDLYRRYELERRIYKSFLRNSGLTATLRKDYCQKLAELPKNSSITRIKNYCVLTGRARSVYKKFKLSRISFRELAAKGMLTGVFKSSW